MRGATIAVIGIGKSVNIIDMANSDTKEKILVLRVDVTKAVNEINRYNTMLEESREEEKNCVSKKNRILTIRMNIERR